MRIYLTLHFIPWKPFHRDVLFTLQFKAGIMIPLTMKTHFWNRFDAIISWNDIMEKLYVCEAIPIPII